MLKTNYNPALTGGAGIGGAETGGAGSAPEALEQLPFRSAGKQFDISRLSDFSQPRFDFSRLRFDFSPARQGGDSLIGLAQ